MTRVVGGRVKIEVGLRVVHVVYARHRGSVVAVPFVVDGLMHPVRSRMHSRRVPKKLPKIDDGPLHDRAW